MQKTIKLSSILAYAGIAAVAIAIIATLSTVHAQDNTSDATSDTDLKSVASRCVSAQSKIRTLQQQVTDVATKRAKVYSQIDARLYIAIGKAKIGGKDTADLEKARAELADKVAKYAAQTQAYSQTLGGISAQASCKDDPSGFQASIDTARTQLADIRTINTDIRSFVNDDTKSAVSALTANGDDDSSSDDAGDN